MHEGTTSKFNAPKLLKERAHERLSSFTPVEVVAALDRLMRRGDVQRVPLMRDSHGKPRHTLIVTDKTSVAENADAA